MRNAIVALAWMVLAGALAFAAEPRDDGWIRLFDGETFNGWKAVENPDTWKIEDGKLVCHGPRSHLFYMGDEQPFKNFEFKADVMTTPGSNSGIYFHTQYQETGWPRYGFEIQVNVSHKDVKKSGGLYSVLDVANPPCKDNEWYTQTIIVRGKRVISKINDIVVADYREPEGKQPESDKFDRVIGSGTFALQGHDPASLVYFKNILVKRLPDDIAEE